MNHSLIPEWVIWFLCILIIVIAKWIIFKKAGEKWWKAIIPIYNDYILFKIAWHKKWFLWVLFPPMFVIMKIIILFNIAKKFQKKAWFALWLSFVPVVFYPILARWKAKYDSSKKMSWTLFWTVIAGIVWAIALLWWAFLWVLYHPGQNEKLDELRLKIQTPIMKSLSDYLIDTRSSNIFWLIDEHEFNENDFDMISRKEFEPYVDQLERWDIIFTDWARYISSIIIPWTWKHALIYLWNWEIIDATSEWVTTWELKDLDNLSRGSLLKQIIAFRPNLTDEQKEKFIQFAFDQLGKPYDFDYNKEDKDAYYCSELVADWLASMGLDITYESESVWRMVISPEDAVNYVKEVWIPNWEFEDIFWLTKKPTWNERLDKREGEVVNKNN